MIENNLLHILLWWNIIGISITNIYIHWFKIDVYKIKTYKLVILIIVSGPIFWAIGVVEFITQTIKLVKMKYDKRKL